MLKTASPRWQAAFWFFLLASLFMSPVLTGRTFYAADVRYSHPLWYDGEHQTRNYDLVDSFTLFYPYDKFYNEGFKQGEFRTWNPNILCGHPVYSSGGSGVLYPPRLLAHFLLPAHHAHDLMLWLHLFLSGFFMFSFLKKLECSQVAGLLGGTVWMFNGYSMTWLESEFTVCYGALLPLILERLTAALDRSRIDWTPAITASLCMGVVCLAGHTQFWANSMLLAGFWTLYLCLKHRHFRALPGLGFVMFVPIGVASIQLLPILDLASRTGRADREFGLVVGAFRNVCQSLPFTLIVPDILGTPLEDFALSFVSPRGNWLMLESCAYLGVATLPLIAYSFVGSRQHRHWKFLAAGFLLLLIVPATPLFYPAYKLIPGFTKMASTRLLFLWVLLGAVLSALGLDALSRAPKKHWRIVSGLVFGVLLVALIGLAALQTRDWQQTATWLVQENHIRMPFREFSGSQSEYVEVVRARMSEFYRFSNPGFILALLWLGASAAVFGLRAKHPKMSYALLILIALDLGIFGFRFNTTSTEQELASEPPAFSHIKSQPGLNRVLSLGTIRPNTGSPFNVATLGGQDALIGDRVIGLLNALQNGDPSQTSRPFSQLAFPITNAASPLINAAGANFIISYPNRDLAKLGFERVFQQPLQGMTVWRNPDAHPILRMEPNSRRVEGLEGALKVLSSTEDTTVLVEAPAKQGTSSESPKVRAHRPGFWDIQVEGSGWLVILQAYDPGWQAEVDGKPNPIVLAQGAFQAVWIEPGNHQVRLHYKPPRFELGARITAVSLVLLGLAWVWSTRREVEARP